MQIVSSSHSPLMLLGGYKNTYWPMGQNTENRDDVISILGNADVTHGNGTEASDFDMRIGAEASHYFVYGKNANYASVEVELIERYGFKSYTGTIIPVLTNAILENPVDEVWNFDEPDDGHIGNDDRS
ncbi:unnamed protein product [Rhizophagus irregularis]|nr:unnamed protein product [Rhizophagus irregularis]